MTPGGRERLRASGYLPDERLAIDPRLAMLGVAGAFNVDLVHGVVYRRHYINKPLTRYVQLIKLPVNPFRETRIPIRREEFGILLVFPVVSEERSFTRAAAKLATSQSAVSQTVRRIEVRLALRLLTRTTRSATPAEERAGIFFLRRLPAGLTCAIAGNPLWQVDADSPRNHTASADTIDTGWTGERQEHRSPVANLARRAM